jgi:hypothetical protein
LRISATTGTVALRTGWDRVGGPSSRLGQDQVQGRRAKFTEPPLLVVEIRSPSTALRVGIDPADLSRGLRR